MKYYIECYYQDGKPILGNLDGQAVMNCKNYKRTNAYKRIHKIVGNLNHMNGKVAFARIISEDFTILETITP